MNEIYNYVISLNSALTRRKHIESEFNQKDIPFEFFDAINPNEFSPHLQQDWFSHVKKAKLSQGEKGCLLSHITLWQKCISNNLPYICIFEDDILLSDASGLFLKEFSWIEQRFDLNKAFIIRLETFLMPIAQEKIANLAHYQNREFNKLNSVHYGTAGYIISNRAAKYLLKYIKKLSPDNIIPIDEIMFNQALSNKNLLICQLEPAICVQELQVNQETSQLGSQLEEQRRKARKENKPKRTLWQKLLDELRRVKRKKEENKKAKQIVEFL